jgi:hypothetical protein
MHIWGVTHNIFIIVSNELSGKFSELTFATLDLLIEFSLKPVPILNLPFGVLISALIPHR